MADENRATFIIQMPVSSLNPHAVERGRVFLPGGIFLVRPSDTPLEIEHTGWECERDGDTYTFTPKPQRQP